MWNKSQYAISTPIIFIHITLFFAGDARYHINGNQILPYYLFFNMQVINQDVLRTKSSQLKILSTSSCGLYIIWWLLDLYQNLIVNSKNNVQVTENSINRFIMYDITFWMTSCKGIYIKNKRRSFLFGASTSSSFRCVREQKCLHELSSYYLHLIYNLQDT